MSSFAQEGGGTFSPSIPEKSMRLALSKEEREAAEVLQYALQEADAEEAAETSKLKQNNLDLLLERARLGKEKKEKHMQTIISEQMQQCTFQPRINKSPAQMKGIGKTSKAKIGVSIEFSLPESGSGKVDDNTCEISLDSTGSIVDENSNASEVSNSLGQIYEYDSAVPAYERLYAHKDKAPRSSRIVHKSREDTELEKCTFTPKLAPYTPEPTLQLQEIQMDTDGTSANILVPADKPIRAPGWQKNVDRLRHAAAMRPNSVVEEEVQLEELERRYARSKRLFAEGPKEFQFESERRIQDRAAKAKTHAKPRMYVDVKLSAFKTANIPVYDGDDPADLSRCFCKIYAFPRQAYAVLEEVIRQSMEANGLRIPQNQSESEVDGTLGEAESRAIIQPDFESAQEPMAMSMSMSTPGEALDISLSDPTLTIEKSNKGKSTGSPSLISSRAKIRLRTRKEGQTDRSQVSLIDGSSGDFFHSTNNT